MDIVMAASEAFPFCKTGGLADVVGSLSQQLAGRKGNKVILFLPHYRDLRRLSSLKVVPGEYYIPIGDRIERVSLSYVSWGKVLVFFVENRHYFDRPGFYRTKNGDYADNDERFILFSRAILEGCKFIGFRPDIIHCHDWQTGLIPAYLKTVYKLDAFFTRTRSLLTIHNIAYQGHFGYSSFEKAGFHPVDFVPDKFEYYGGISFLKSGIVFADQVNTVSPHYADELQNDPSMGFGLEGLLKYRSKNFCGIVNGIDTEIWDPETDTYLPMGYDAATFSKNKPISKQQLQQKFELEENTQKPIVGIVSRLDYQKGLDFALPVIEKWHKKVQFAILGCGDPALEKKYIQLAKKYPADIGYVGKLDEELAHQIYAGCDLFLMPSRYEPCGLSQMIAMKYGSLPMVTKVGGLVDTVVGYQPESDNAAATGFFIEGFNEQSIAATLLQAMSLYEEKKTWNKLVKNAMLKDNSWDRSAQDYFELYKKTLS